MFQQCFHLAGIYTKHVPNFGCANCYVRSVVGPHIQKYINVYKK